MSCRHPPASTSVHRNNLSDRLCQWPDIDIQAGGEVKTHPLTLCPHTGWIHLAISSRDTRHRKTPRLPSGHFCRQQRFDNTDLQLHQQKLEVSHESRHQRCCQLHRTRTFNWVLDLVLEKHAGAFFYYYLFIYPKGIKQWMKNSAVNMPGGARKLFYICSADQVIAGQQSIYHSTERERKGKY